MCRWSGSSWERGSRPEGCERSLASPASSNRGGMFATGHYPSRLGRDTQATAGLRRRACDALQRCHPGRGIYPYAPINVFSHIPAPFPPRQLPRILAQLASRARIDTVWASRYEYWVATAALVWGTFLKSMAENGQRATDGDVCWTGLQVCILPRTASMDSCLVMGD